MKLSEVRLTFTLLEKALGLTSNIKIVGIRETDYNQFIIRLSSNSKRKTPQYFMIDSLSKIGEVYSDPNKYEKEYKQLRDEEHQRQKETYQRFREERETKKKTKTKNATKRPNNRTSRKTTKSKPHDNKKTMQ